MANHRSPFRVRADVARARFGRSGLLFAAAAFLLAGCASGPQATRSAPAWVLEPPQPTDRHEFFVATGTDASGDLRAAEQQAASSLLTRINQALGVDVSVLTTAEARSTLDEYEASVREEVTQSGSGRLEGFRVADRYVVREEGRVTVHLLGEYERSAFAAEREERRELVAAREALLLDRERAAEQAVASGRLADGLALYLGVANTAARAEETRIAPVVLERSLQRAADAMAGLRLEPVSGPTRVETGSVPDDPVQFAARDAAGRGVPGVPVEVSYRDESGSRTLVRRATLSSDANGFVRFAFPRVQVVGEVEVTARLDTSAVDSLLAGLPDAVSAEREALEVALATPRAVWRFTALSRAREIPTAVVIAETDAAGTAMPTRRTADGVVQSLSEAGFRVIAGGLHADRFAGTDVAELIGALQTSLPAEAKRVVTGTASIAEYEEGDGVLVKVTATIQVADLRSGEIIYSTSAVKNARSATAERAISTAFLQLGRTIGEELAARLP
ncbi:MAG: hypothetical protein ACOC2D_10905 [Spirochaetota bacterium]